MKPALLLAFLMAAAPASLPAADANWPEFRGPRGDGITTSKLPTTWSETNNVKWKTAIHGKGWSSPVVWGKQVWMTTAPEDGRELFAICVDKETGKVVRNQKLFDVEKPQFVHKFNSHASPTPAIEEGRVYITFGAPGTACLDTKTGKVLWERRDFECNHYRGAGSSPILWKNLLIVNFDGSDHQFIVALDKATGKTVWRKDRSIDFKDLGPDGQPKMEGDLRKAFATCHVAELGGVTTLLSQGANALYAYNPRTGEELWRVEERTSHSGGTRPAIGNGLVYIPTGWSQGQTLAIKPGKKGDVLDANAASAEGAKLQVAWKSKRGTPKKPSLTLVGERLFGIEDGGVVNCWNAKTGEQIWSERIGGNYSASPIVAGGRLYAFNEEGKGIVIATGGPFAKLAENQLADGVMSSPAVSGNALFVRTKTHLYRIQE